MKTLLTLISSIIFHPTYGTEGRIRYIDPIKEAELRAKGTIFKLPGRERRAGKAPVDSNKTETPSEPGSKVKNEVGDPPEDFEKKISNLEKEVKDLKEDLSSATSQLETYSKERKELKQEIIDLKDKINAGPGSIIKGWAFSPELRWIYLSPTTMPYVYSQNDGWMLYQYGTNPRRVYYFNTKEWKILKNEK